MLMSSFNFRKASCSFSPDMSLALAGLFRVVLDYPLYEYFDWEEHVYRSFTTVRHHLPERHRTYTASEMFSLVIQDVIYYICHNAPADNERTGWLLTCILDTMMAKGDLFFKNAEDRIIVWQDGKTQFTVLHSLVSFNSVPLIKKVIEYAKKVFGEDNREDFKKLLSTPNHKGHTPLQMAEALNEHNEHNEQSEMVNYLRAEEQKLILPPVKANTKKRHACQSAADAADEIISGGDNADDLEEGELPQFEEGELPQFFDEKMTPSSLVSDFFVGRGVVVGDLSHNESLKRHCCDEKSAPALGGC